MNWTNILELLPVITVVVVVAIQLTIEIEKLKNQKPISSNNLLMFIVKVVALNIYLYVIILCIVFCLQS